MKFLTFLLTIVVLHLTACAQKDVPANKNALPAHPRILLLSGEETLIKSTIASDNTWRTVHNAILDQCMVINAKPPVERVLIGRRLLDKSREALKRIFYLSYAWRMTGNKLYLERAENFFLLRLEPFSFSRCCRNDNGNGYRVRLAL
jgi:hypothetical protein